MKGLKYDIRIRRLAQYSFKIHEEVKCLGFNL
jgi:hypothetical protein